MDNKNLQKQKQSGQDRNKKKKNQIDSKIAIIKRHIYVKFFDFLKDS